MWHDLDQWTTHRREFVTDRFLHFDQTIVKLITKQFTNSTDTTVTQVVTVINVTFTVFNFDDVFNRIDDVFMGQYCHVFRYVKTQFVIHLHTTDLSQVITLRIKEQLVYKSFRCIFSDRLAWTHYFVNTNRSKIILIFDIFCLFQQFQ